MDLSPPAPQPSREMLVVKGLNAGTFYAVIVSGVIMGALLCAIAGWYYLQFGDQRPNGRRIWDTDATSFIIPISVMIGATFGGLLGVGLAIAWDWRSQTRDRKTAGYSDKGNHSVTSKRE